MKQNEGWLDRVIRLLIAGLFGYLYFGKIVTGGWGIVLLIVGVVLVLTSALGFCPLYSLFKFSTKKKSSSL